MKIFRSTYMNQLPEKSAIVMEKDQKLVTWKMEA